MIKKLKSIKWKYIFFKSYVRIWSDSYFEVGKRSRIKKSTIICLNHAKLKIGKDCLIENVYLYVTGGIVEIGDFSRLIGNNSNDKSVYILDNGCLRVAHHCRLSVKRIWIRFGGNTQVGSYTNINFGSEIRCDESVKIGSYNQISYDVRIWDTNTHNIYTPEKRVEITRQYYPYFGYEIEKPKTLPVCIGDNCWIGERAAIMKGTKIGNNVIVGYNTTILNKVIDNDKKVIQKIELKML